MIRITAVSIGLLCLIGCSSDTEKTLTDSPTLSRFRKGEFLLLRLNGNRHPGEAVPSGTKLLHGWEILESLQIRKPRDRAKIFLAFEAGEDDARRNPGIPVDCFQPRHAIHITANGTTIDHLICFECQNFMTWTNGEMTGSGPISDHPKATFESYFDAAPSR